MYGRGMGVPALGRHDDRQFAQPLGAIIFDGDDTLWWTEPIYDEARSLARSVVEAAALDGEYWEATERTRDVENVPRLGLSRARFPTSCVEAYRAAANALDTPIDPQTENRVWAAADSVFGRHAPLAEGAQAILDELRSDFPLALLTKGDLEIQRTRIARSGLDDRFDFIEIVDHKNADAFKRIAAKLECPAPLSWSVGNSWTSDVVPALEVGMCAVWVPAHVWEYEQHGGGETHPSVVRVSSLLEVPAAIYRALAKTKRGTS